MENKEKLSNLIKELRAILETAGWGVMVTDFGNKPLVGQEGKVTSTKSSVRLLITVGDSGKEVKLNAKGKGK